MSIFHWPTAKKKKLSRLLEEKERSLDALTLQVKSLEEELAGKDSALEQLQQQLHNVKVKKSRLTTIMQALSVLLAVAAVAVLTTNLWLPVFQVVGASMDPTLEEGDYVLTAKGSSVDRGDIIAFYHNNKVLLKRVIGLPGDEILISSAGEVLVNGTVLDEPYLVCTSEDLQGNEYSVRVPDNSYFVLGDNRAVSVDSRSTEIGNVSQKLVIGKVILNVWPIKWLAGDQYNQ